MASGNRRLVINTRERAISDDIRRLQAFAAADRSAWDRRMLDDLYVFDVNAGFGYPTTAITSPLTADIIGGLMVQPVIGSSNLIVFPGVMGTYYPDAVPSDDDDPYKVIADPGVQTLGVLTISANAGPGIRIDVIECQPVDVVEEQDNRDIFDPATGLFTPALVDKVVSGRLTYRVREGAAGGGFPGTALGWLPLVVASVPSGGGASVDDVTFWDVRPLVPDRWEPPIRGGTLLTHRTRMNILGDAVIAPGEIRVKGNVEGNYGPYKAGGTLAKGTPTTPMGSGDVAYVNAMNPENWEPGLAPVANNPAYLWALYPFGLHRWVRYTENDFAGYGRIPGGMRGITTFSTTGPTGFGGGNPALAIALPASTGLGSSTQQAFLLAATYADSINVPHGFLCDGLMTHLKGTGITWATAALSGTAATYIFVGNASHPGNARSILVKFNALFTAAAGTTDDFYRIVQVHDASGAVIVATPHQSSVNVTMAAGGAFLDTAVVEIPIPTNWPSAALANLKVIVDYATPAAFTLASADANILGWRLLP